MTEKEELQMLRELVKNRNSSFLKKMKLSADSRFK